MPKRLFFCSHWFSFPLFRYFFVPFVLGKIRHSSLWFFSKFFILFEFLHQFTLNFVCLLFHWKRISDKNILWNHNTWKTIISKKDFSLNVFGLEREHSLTWSPTEVTSFIIHLFDLDTSEYEETYYSFDWVFHKVFPICEILLKMSWELLDGMWHQLWTIHFTVIAV